MTDYPYLRAWAQFHSLGRGWIERTLEKAHDTGAPDDAWAWSVKKNDWATLDELRAAAAAGNAYSHEVLAFLEAYAETEEDLNDAEA